MPRIDTKLEQAAGAKADTVGARLRALASQARHGWLRMLGAPDYEAYLQHHRCHHPEAPLMSEREYARVFIDRRYNRKDGGGRCC